MAGPVIEIREVLTGPPPQGDVGKGLLLRTDRGDIAAILHEALGSRRAVVWVCGARGGFGGPAQGMFGRMAEAFQTRGITSVRLDYRQPNVLSECVLDLLAAIAFCKAAGYDPVVLGGHSFGGAVVIAAGVASSHV